MRINTNSKFLKILILIGIILIITTLKDTYQLWKIGDIVGMKEQKMVSLEQTQIELKNKIELATSAASVEKYARNKLNWIKSGEKLVILPNDLFATPEAKTSVDLRPNWRKWWDLVF